MIQADHKIENNYEKYIFKYTKEQFILVIPPPPNGLVHRLLWCSGWLISVINVWLPLEFLCGYSVVVVDLWDPSVVTLVHWLISVIHVFYCGEVVDPWDS